MKRFFRNIPWKNILIIGLVVVLGVGAIAGISAIAKNEKKTISSTAFKRGAIDQNGFYIESDNSLYTKDLIECQGLEIAPDFESTGTYQVFYYDSNKQFLGATEVLDSQSDGVYVKGDNFAVAKYCRIMITPETPKGEDGHVIEDYKIKFYEIAGIAGKYKISVDKEQKFMYSDNLFEIDPDMDGKYWYGLEANNTFTPVVPHESGPYSSAFVDCTSYSKLLVGIIRNGSGEDINYEYIYFGNDEDNSKLASIRVPCSTTDDISDIVFYTIDIPEGATRFSINYNDKTENYTFVYGIK